MPEIIAATTTEVAPGLFVGAQHECAMPDAAWTRGSQRAEWTAVVHAAKYPCHAELLGYAEQGKRVDPESPEYLIARRPRHLLMNMIDADEKFFRLDFFAHALYFITEAMRDGGTGDVPRGPRVLVHCNQGLSRAPSIALMYLAKRTEEFDPLERATFDAARKAFTARYPVYTPGKGIAAFLDRWWGRMA